MDQNISYVFNLSMRIGGVFDPVSKWKAQCPDNYVVTGKTEKPNDFLVD